MRVIRSVTLAVTTGLLLVVAGMAASAAAAPAAGPHVCKGTLHKPGVLKGTYPNGVVVKGACAVKSGKAHVIGTLTVTKGGVLAAAFGLHHSKLTLTGNLVVDKGATAIVGCKVNPNGSGLPCLDETNMAHPTLTSHELITGSIIENSPLGVIVHNSTIRGNVKETGGGGGLSCAPPKSGVFAQIMSPVYSDYEDSTIGGKVRISGLSTCWLGLARDSIHRSLAVDTNVLADPDGIEILANHITKNLSCKGNSHPAADSPPGTYPVWDGAENFSNPPGVIYPRVAEPNTVGGKRNGQCVLQTPTTQGGMAGPGAF